MTLLLCGAILWPSRIYASDSTNRALITIQGFPIATRGFPCVLKITVHGPGLIPNATIFDENMPIRVTFSAVSSNTTHTLFSSKGKDIIYIREGQRVDYTDQEKWQTRVKEGQRQSILIDLASITPQIGRGWLFEDLAPGEYNVAITIPGFVARSNSIRLRVVAPDEVEDQYLASIQRQGSFSRGKGVNWSRVLQSKVRPSLDNWDRLSTTTREQTSFHMLLARLTASDNVLGPDDEIAIKTTALPKFLEPERECLLYEVRTAMGKSDEAEAFRLMKRYPDLEWRLREIKVGGKDFLRYRKVVTGKSK